MLSRIVCEISARESRLIFSSVGFTPEVTEIKANLKTLYASGGGDGPEAVTAALHALTEMEWRQRATRMAVLIADAPPHGIGEVGRRAVKDQR